MIKLSLRRKNTPYTSEWGDSFFENVEELFRLMEEETDGVNNFYLHTFTREYHKEGYETLDDYLFDTIIGGHCWNGDIDNFDEAKILNWLSKFENYKDFKEDVEQQGELAFLLDNKGYIVEVNEKFYLVPENLTETKQDIVSDIIYDFYDDRFNIELDFNSESPED